MLFIWTKQFLGAEAPLEPASSESLYVCLYEEMIKYITQLA